MSRRFDSEIEGLLSGFSWEYGFEEIVLISDGNCNGGSCVYSVSGICTRLSWGWSLTVLIAVGCL